MDGKTFVRVFGFAQSYGHGWANALTSDAAEQDPIVGPFARAAGRMLTSGTMVRAEAEAEMASLSESLDQQKALVEAADRLLAEEEGEIPGIRAGSCFMERNSDLHYDHITGSGRLEIWVHDGMVEFSISRPGQQDLFCLAVSPTNGETGVFSRDLDPVKRRVFRVYSGDPVELFSEDHDACMRRWKQHLRIRHVWAIEDAIRSFFSLMEDQKICADIISAIRTEAAHVFREQSLTAEVSFWDWKEEEYCTAVLSHHASQAHRGNKLIHLTRVNPLLLQEMERVHTLSNDKPSLIPFNYEPDSPEASFFKNFFKLPTEGISYSNMRGICAVLGAACHEFPAGNGERCEAEVVFAVGVNPDDIRRHTAKYSDNHTTTNAAIRRGIEDAVAERSTTGAFWKQRDINLSVDYPTQSLAALEFKK